MSRIDVVDTTSEPGHAGMPGAPLSLAAPKLDPEEYRADLAELGLTEQQETEFLETLWSIMGTFARMGFAVDVCGSIFADFNQASTPESADGKLVSSTTKETPASDQSHGGII
jgi:hypothetical protein